MVAKEPNAERFYRVQRKDLAYFQFILEGYEGLVTATTIDNNLGIVKLFIMPGRAAEADQVLSALEKELCIQEISDIVGERRRTGNHFPSIATLNPEL
ncbi:MAG: DUF4911 domain-containing protein [Syntrophales bacterium]|nr:DUF4911 domain-containing protein [Syntrophales bacterium]HPL62792.1 DUF4911 domain-containing protein [Syntrophales bacterium]